MNAIRKLLTAFALVAGMVVAPAIQAADSPLPDLGTSAVGRAAQAQEALKKDAVCTRCHDESETKPILSYYQGRHGVKAEGAGVPRRTGPRQRWVSPAEKSEEK